MYTYEPEERELAIEQESKKYKIAVVPKQHNIPYFRAVEKGAIDAAEELEMELIYQGPALADSDLQISTIQEIMDQNVDLIAVSAIDPNKLAPVLKEAQNKGIEVITWDSDVLSSSRSFFINMVNPETLGRHLMDMMALTMDDHGDFAIITGSASAANINEWLKWIKIQHEEYYPNMNLVEVVPTDDNPAKAYEIAIDLMKEYPDLKGVIGNSSVGPPAAAQAVMDLGKKGEVSVVGLSSPSEMKGYLNNGAAQVSTLWSPEKLGYLTVSLSKQLLEGEYPNDLQDVPNVGRIQVKGDTVIMGEPIDFTKENVDQYDF
ncbi:autoinducer 2 ABC transporter substrate-binding protein [Gracilibacillus sp. YIM 98692]|uniref:autoinducer 2 ABC transporter substrate-binding protein n=1 Tax=Gracilibacillus sp. YIM 98692 TaxID=2663532 RepID=UPI001F09123A|nr:autoinducer 2 ABC transporter substrate-binding protein [Gracilibacillus sp. YIM 98692]